MTAAAGTTAQVLAATQTPKDKEWFQGTADAVRQYNWMLEDVKNRVVENIIILSGDHLCALLASACKLYGVSPLHEQSSTRSHGSICSAMSATATAADRNGITSTCQKYVTCAA